MQYFRLLLGSFGKPLLCLLEIDDIPYSIEILVDIRECVKV